MAMDRMTMDQMAMDKMAMDKMAMDKMAMEKMEMEKMEMEKIDMSKMQKIQYEKDAETIPVAPAQPMNPLVPASTYPLGLDRRFYILSGQPQFFGKFDALRQPAIVAPTQALRARSAESEIQAAESAEHNSYVNILPQQQQLVQLPQIVPLQAGAAIQLRSTFTEPIQQLNPLPVLPEEEEGKDKKEIGRSNEPSEPEEDESSQLQEGRSFYRSQSVADDTSNNLMLKSKEEQEPSEDPSVANAKPHGIAVAGKGGVASAKPSATAVVGVGGLALSSPAATAISGDFDDEDDKNRTLQE